MEYLSFNQYGQWKLEKKQPANADFNSYHNFDNKGRLTEDRGQRGRLHANPPSRSTPQMSDEKMEAELTTPVKSKYALTHPGQSTLT